MNDYQVPQTPKDGENYVINHSQLPLHCPTADMSLWNAHPRVFLPIEKNGHATCPYCGTKFLLKSD